jgi:SAM-dependent methyltransferase
MTLFECFVRLFGPVATAFYGDPTVYDRYKWIKLYLKPGPLRTLDLGCGFGALSMYSAKIGNKVVALDYSELNLSKAKSWADILKLFNISFLRADIRELSSHVNGLGKFDQIICCEVIEHILDDKKLINDIFKLLKPNGLVLLSTPYEKHKPLLWEKYSYAEMGGHVRYGYNIEQLKQLLGDYGFHISSCDYIGGIITQYLFNINWIISKLNGKLSLIISTFFMPLRLLDNLLTNLIGYNYLSICVIAFKR